MPRVVALLIALAALAGAAPAYAGLSAAADGTAYGGSAYLGGAAQPGALANPSLGLLVRPDGRVTARASFTIACGNVSYVERFARLSGMVSGTEFSASGHARVPGHHSALVFIEGSADGQTATGAARVYAPHCSGYKRGFILRTESAPAGVPAVPAPRARLTGVTQQSAAGVRLPISILVTHNGKVTAFWDALLHCQPGVSNLENSTPPTPIRADGSFTRSERFTVRYATGIAGHFSVKLTGAFRADGVSGTLRASLRRTKPGSRHRPCTSGTQAWAASAR
jgi:hypothetical protein